MIRQGRSRAMLWGWIVGLGVLGLIGAYAVLARPVLQFAPIASAYGAKKVCSCVFVAERDLDSCRVDFTEDVSAVTFTRERDAIRADLLNGRFAERAVFTPGQGCRLVPIPD